MGEMSREEENMIEEMEANRNLEQARREENQRRMDRMFSAHHDKIHNIFLEEDKFFFFSFISKMSK